MFNNKMETKTIIKAGILGTFLYSASPLAQIAIVDTGNDALSNGITSESTDYPNVIRSSVLAETVYADGFHLDDSFNFWRARLSPELDDCISEETALSYTGAASWAMHDHAECLSELTGVAVEDIIPKPEDGYDYERYLRQQELLEPDETDASLG